MKYSKLLNDIKNNDKFFDSYIDYKYLKKNILNTNFIELLDTNINLFNNQYIEKYKYNHIFKNKLYEYILINYLSIHKIIKKLNKKNHILYDIFIKKYDNINNYLNKFNFYNDIINIPNNLEYKTNDLCSICLDNCINPITTKCNHTFCLKCLIKTNKFFDFCPNCKTKTIIDPIYIIFNNILKCDIKYSPFYNNQNKIKLDIMSDLHIDQWSFDYDNLYPCGPIINKPFQLNNTNSDYLIIAGDISDNINISIDFLNDISKHYNKILFIDGNHEHVNKYPLLYDTKYIQTLIHNKNIHYLSTTPYIINNTAFIGSCGWWDYDNSNLKSINQNYNYFNDWIKHFTIDDNKQFIDNVIIHANKEYEYLNYNIQKLNQDNNINNIIIVTHTLPNIDLCQELSILDTATHINTKLSNLFKYNKITHWIFGHTHEQYNKKINNIQFICNPRGRPEDFNRLIYKQIDILI